MIQQTMGQFNGVTRGLLLRVLKEDSRVCFSQNPKKEILLLFFIRDWFSISDLGPWVNLLCSLPWNYSPPLIFKSMSDDTAIAIASAAVSYSISYLTSKFIIKFLESSLEGAKLT